ncbi:ATP-binding protein [Gordonia sp. GN26]
MTSFVGRRREIDEARSRLQQSRLVTIVGPGGVGKTRLAEEVSGRSARAFRDRACWIDLAAVREPDALPSAAAAGLGVTDQSNRPVMDKIIDHLRTRNMMIVVDNCEHVLDAAASFVATVLDDGPEIRILATSRERLGVGGEAIFELPPLSVPPSAAGVRTSDLGVYESVTLLVERARSAVPDFTLDDKNAESIAQLCIALDGIPLAVELAAVRLRSLSPVQLVQRLDDRFALLTGGNRTDLPRQQTLRAMIDWSYDLCSDSERRLWSRLSVFPGGFDLEAAETVCRNDGDDPDEVINVLDQLIAKSLVSVDRSGAVLRYSQLMTVREYGQELLDRAGDRDDIYRRHRDHYLERAERYARDWFGPRQSDQLAQLRVDHPNLIAAIDWSLRERDLAEAARLAVALRYHWIAGGNLADGRIRLERLLDRLPEARTERAHVLWVTAWTALIQGDRDGAEQHLAECAVIAEEQGDIALMAYHDQWAGLHHLFTGRTTDAIRSYRRAIPVHRKLDPAAALTAEFQLAMAQVYEGALDDALATSANVIAVADDYDERWNKAYALWVAGLAHFHRADIAAAGESATRALRIQRDFKDKICTALSIELLAWAAEAEGRCEKSARLFGAARAVWNRLGTSVTAFGPGVAADSIAAQQRLASAMRPAVFRDLITPPAQMTISGAVELALETPAAEPAAAERETNPLTKRENEIAELVAEGMSNRAIADKLVVSRRTVDGHVERILSKLGVGSRTQVVAWLQANR